MKVRYWQNLQRTIGWLVVGGWLVLTAGPALAALSQGFPSDSDLPAGTIVALSADGSGKVVTANQSLADRVIGVVVESGDSPLSLEATSGQVQVVTSGPANVLVSTAGGDIKSGDVIALSTIAGVGMKATASGRIIGIAQGSFSSSTQGAETGTVGSGSSTKQIALGEIPVQIGVSSYTVQTPSTGVLGIVQNFANTIAGKPVTVLRLLVAGVIVLAAVISATVLLYSAVRNSIIAIGRNPLARGAIFRSLAQILIIVVLILLVAGGASYVVIK